MRRFRAALRGLAVALVAVSIVAPGLPGGLNNLDYAVTPGQYLVAYADIAFGLAAIVALVGYAGRWPWAVPAILVWAAAAVVAAAVAPVAWGGAELWTGVVSGLVTAAIALGVVRTWLARQRAPADRPGP